MRKDRSLEKLVCELYFELTPVIQLLFNEGIANPENVSRKMKAAIMGVTCCNRSMIKKIMGLSREEKIRWGKLKIIPFVRFLDKLNEKR
jgi:hypothetical protein